MANISVDFLFRVQVMGPSWQWAVAFLLFAQLLPRCDFHSGGAILLAAAAMIVISHGRGFAAWLRSLPAVGTPRPTQGNGTASNADEWRQSRRRSSITLITLRAEAETVLAETWRKAVTPLLAAFRTNSELGTSISARFDIRENGHTCSCRGNSNPRTTTEAEMCAVATLANQRWMSEELEKCGTQWDIDVFKLERETGGHALLAATCEAMRNLVPPGVVGDWNVIRRLLHRTEQQYFDKQYHNRNHAALVVHHGACLTNLIGASAILDPKETLCLMLAAAGHDVAHPGKTNQYFVNTSHHLAEIYNESSVLEQYHAFIFLQLLNAPGCNALQDFSPREGLRLKSLIVDLILATDLATHFEFLQVLKKRRLTFDLHWRDPMTSDRKMLMSGVIKAADVAYLAMKFVNSWPWTRRIYEEFWVQGDEELNLGVPLSPLCDRRSVEGSPDLFLHNARFIQFVVSPLFSELSKYECLVKYQAYQLLCGNERTPARDGRESDSLSYCMRGAPEGDGRRRLVRRSFPPSVSRRASVNQPLLSAAGSREYAPRSPETPCGAGIIFGTLERPKNGAAGTTAVCCEICRLFGIDESPLIGKLVRGRSQSLDIPRRRRRSSTAWCPSTPSKRTAIFLSRKIGRQRRGRLYRKKRRASMAISEEETVVQKTTAKRVRATVAALRSLNAATETEDFEHGAFPKKGPRPARNEHLAGRACMGKAMPPVMVCSRVRQVCLAPLKRQCDLLHRAYQMNVTAMETEKLQALVRSAPQGP